MINFPNTEFLLSRDVIACDTETTGLCWWKDKIFGISISWFNDDGTVGSFYGDLREGNTLRWFRDHLPKCQKIVNQFVKFDAHMLRGSRIAIPTSRMDCTMVREALIDENRHEYGLDRLMNKYLGHGKKDVWATLAGMFNGKADKETQAANLVRAPRELVEEYANVDSSGALLIWDRQEQIIRKEDLTRVASLEQRLLGTVIKMEHGGVPVDLDRAEKSANQLDREVRKSQRELDRMVGYPLNVNSSPQVKKQLGVHKGDDGFWRTKDGVLLEPTESGNSGALRLEKLYQCQLPEARHIAEIRAMIKARDVFLRKYILTMSHKGSIHASINQTRTEEGDGTYTGRFSITEPALQQIHKRNKKMAAIVRSCFIPDTDHDWGCFDWSQADFRIFAHYVNDPKINVIYANDSAADFHRVTADITGLPRDKDEKTGGANSKQMNLGLIFGMSAGRMAREMFLPYTVNEKGFYEAGPEAKALFSKYHINIPGAERLRRAVASVARSRGYIKTQLGRRLRFPGGHDAYKAAGILYQAQAAECMKIKLVELDDLIKDMPVRLMLTVHDEFDISLHKGRNMEIDQEIKHLLERFDGDLTPIHLRIPLLCSEGIGENWYEASR